MIKKERVTHKTDTNGRSPYKSKQVFSSVILWNFSTCWKISLQDWGLNGQRKYFASKFTSNWYKTDKKRITNVYQRTSTNIKRTAIFPNFSQFLLSVDVRLDDPVRCDRAISDMISMCAKLLIFKSAIFVSQYFKYFYLSDNIYFS